MASRKDNAKVWYDGADCVQVTQFELPFPPSLNAYYGTNKFGRVYVKAAGKQYRAGVRQLSIARKFPKFGEARLAVSLGFYMPDRRKRDLDNLEKCLFDALGTHPRDLKHPGAELYADDSQIDEKHAKRVGVEKPGKVVVTIGVIP